MTQIFTNSGLGIANSSIAQLGNYGPKDKALLGQGDEMDSSGKQTIEWTFYQGLVQEITAMSAGERVHHLRYDYDRQHRLCKVSRDLGEGKVYWLTYDYAGDSSRITAIHQSDGTALRIDYDDKGRVKNLVDGEGRSTSYQYSPGKTLVTNDLAATWAYRYDDENRLTGIDGPGNSHTRYEYEGKYLAAVHQGSLHWQLSYNEAGDCIRIQEPTGQITTRIFDSEHRLLNETSYTAFDGNHHPLKPQTSRCIYDDQGHLRFKVSKDGTVLEHRYNKEGQLESSRNYLHTDYDLSQFTSDRVLTLIEMLSWVEKQNPQAISLVHYHYDWRGLLDEEVHYAQIDGQGEGLSKDALLTRFRYDAAGRLVGKAVPLAHDFSITTYLYDDLGRLIQRVDNQKHYERFEYDDTHQRVITTDANGLQTIRTYDHAGLLFTTQYLDSKQWNYGTIRYSYDGAGRLQSEINADGKASYYFYDNEGQLIAKCEPGGRLSEYRYDNEKRLLQTIHYHDAVATTSWSTKIPVWLAIKPKPDPKDRVSQTIYNDYNQIAYQIDAEGAVIAFTYNAAGQIISKTAYATRLNNTILSQTLTAANLSLQTSTDDRCHYFFYDAEGRLHAEVDGEGAATAFRYDREGHVWATIRYANRISFPLYSEWVAPKSSSRDIYRFSLFNAVGSKVADIDPLGYPTTYEYNERGLLIKKHSFSTKLDETVFETINDKTTVADLALSKRPLTIPPLIPTMI